MKDDHQFDAVARLTAAFEGQLIDYWLFGGWAVDFHVGRITRPHADIDIAIWHADLQRATKVLGQDGWAHAPEPGEDGYTVFQNGPVRLDVAFLARDEQVGTVYTPLRAGRGDWPEGSFGSDVALLDGVQAHVITLASLIADKSEVRNEPSTQAKDRADVRVLLDTEPADSAGADRWATGERPDIREGRGE